jgi:hypothetical protein
MQVSGTATADASEVPCIEEVDQYYRAKKEKTNDYSLQMSIQPKALRLGHPLWGSSLDKYDERGSNVVKLLNKGYKSLTL